MNGGHQNFVVRFTVRALPALAIAMALVLGWRALVAGKAVLADADAPAVHLRADTAFPRDASEAAWRARIAQDPSDHVALAILARVLEQQGHVADARTAMNEALRLAPADRQTLIEAGAFHLRAGDAMQAMPYLRRAADLYPEARAGLWPAFVAVLDDRRTDAYFADIARDSPEWWPEFFGYACAKARNADALQKLLGARANAGTAGANERRCLVDRMQRDNLWPGAYQAWLNSLPEPERQRIGYVYNGDFERPISNLGFDWTIPAQDGVFVAARPVAGAGGQRALEVEFVNKRWSVPPAQQYLMLVPGKYRFEGRGRADRLQTWLGVQWGLYCLPDGGRAARQLARTGPFLGTSGWEGWREDFAVPADCPVQLLRLELANPRRDAVTPGDVAARLDGAVWFDDFRVRSLD